MTEHEIQYKITVTGFLQIERDKTTLAVVKLPQKKGNSMKTILVIDDNKINLASAKGALADLYKVIAVISGEQALTYLQNYTPDLILLDINMPEMDGFEVMAKIREMEGKKDIPIIFLTADNDADTENKCLELGALDFIGKPFVPNVMRARIARILELEDLRRELADRLDQKIQEVEQIQTKSAQDPLCGLWNKAYVEEKVGNFIREGGKGALFMMDLDNFKGINDTYGHLAGDKTLVMYAETLRNHAGVDDVVGRIGGDEFMMFVSGEKSKEELSNLAGAIIREMTAKIEQCKYETNTSVSIGIAQVPTDAESFETCFSAADKALYFVKQNGKNMYHFYSESKQKESERAGTVVDLKYLREVIARGDANAGAYMVDYDNFHQMYNFIRRFVERNGREAQLVLFTAEMRAGQTGEVQLMEKSLEALEEAVFSSLRRVDVSTRYSSKQLIVILMDSNIKNGEKVAERIIGEYNNQKTAEMAEIEYSIATMGEKKLGGGVK